MTTVFRRRRTGWDVLLEARGLLIVSGIVSVVLGLFVLFNLASATLTLLGVLLGIQTVVEGLTLLVAGRLRPAAPATGQ
jgi:uncharacterized membrane protein HdeD (DUF308 family)